MLWRQCRPPELMNLHYSSLRLIANLCWAQMQATKLEFFHHSCDPLVFEFRNALSTAVL